MLNTLMLCAATCAISVPSGSFLAWMLTRTDMPGRKFHLTLLGVMLFVPLYLHTGAWQAGFGLSGWATLALGTPAWLQGWAGAVWVHGIAALPWVVLIVGVGLRLSMPELEQQALLDGSAWQVFRYVTLPSALPSIGVAALWVTIMTAGEISVVNLFMVPTYADDLFTQFVLDTEPGSMARRVLPGVMLTTLLLAAGLILCTRLSPGRHPSSFRRHDVFPLRVWRVPLAIAVGLLVVLLVGVPLLNLCYKAGVTVELVGTERHRSWSLGKCLAMVAGSPWRHRREFGWSMSIGGLAATAAVVGGIILAWFARRGGYRAVIVLVIAAVCLATPGPTLAIGIIRVLNRPNSPGLTFLYDQSIFAPWLALSIRALPVATLVMWHALRTVPPSILEAAAVDGAGPMRRLLLIALPSRLSAVALAWVVSLAIVLADVAASVLVVPPGVMTLSIRVFGLLHASVEDQVAGICLAQVIMFAALTAVAMGLIRRWGGSVKRESDTAESPIDGRRD